jgi:hypothetical protein
MASAGRILIMPKGNYNTETEYEMLDLVYHNGTSWLAKKTAKGIEPSDANSEYWQNMLNFDPSDFEARKANGGSIAFKYNPEGKDYFDYTIETPHGNLAKVFANAVETDSIFVIGVSVISYDQHRATVRIKLNQAVDNELNFSIGYLH